MCVVRMSRDFRFFFDLLVLIMESMSKILVGKHMLSDFNRVNAVSI